MRVHGQWTLAGQDAAAEALADLRSLGRPRPCSPSCPSGRSRSSWPLRRTTTPANARSPWSAGASLAPGRRSRISGPGPPRRCAWSGGGRRSGKRRAASRGALSLGGGDLGSPVRDLRPPPEHDRRCTAFRCVSRGTIRRQPCRQVSLHVKGRCYQRRVWTSQARFQRNGPVASTSLPSPSQVLVPRPNCPSASRRRGRAELRLRQGRRAHDPDWARPRSCDLPRTWARHHTQGVTRNPT